MCETHVLGSISTTTERQNVGRPQLYCSVRCRDQQVQRGRQRTTPLAANWAGNLLHIASVVAGVVTLPACSRRCGSTFILTWGCDTEAPHPHNQNRRAFNYFESNLKWLALV
jgi:hypothetical protein